MKVPNGCLLLQAGKLFQHITGGYVLAGFHEVVYSEQTKAVYEKAVAEGKIPWRVSSTMFTHFRYDVDCSPMPELSHLWAPEREANPDFEKTYPKLKSFDILMEELSATNMVAEGSGNSQKSD